MALDALALADQIQQEMEGNTDTPEEKKALATGIVDHIKNSATVDNPSGTVTGTCPSSGGPLQNGAASGGVISGMDDSGATMAQIVDNYGAQYLKQTSELETMCGEIVKHIQNSGQISFPSGNITGQCTNTAVSSGTLLDGAGTGGVLSGLSSSTLADNIHSALGFSGSTNQELKDLSKAIVNHLTNNAESEYSTGSVTGTCPAGGGALIGGTGTGGTIS